MLTITCSILYYYYEKGKESFLYFGRMKTALKEFLEENECLIADGLDDALIGVTNKEGVMVAVYDIGKCIDVFAKDMVKEDAIDYFYHNTLSSYVGEKTPVFINTF